MNRSRNVIQLLKDNFESTIQKEEKNTNVMQPLIDKYSKIQKQEKKNANVMQLLIDNKIQKVDKMSSSVIPQVSLTNKLAQVVNYWQA